MATAPYGFAFDRAMLFLAEEGGALLRGADGIGFMDRQQTERHYRAGMIHGESFEACLRTIQQGNAPTTPLGQAVIGRLFAVGGDDAFRYVLDSGQPIKVKAEDVEARMPAPFVEQFGIAEYDLVPLKSVNRTIGVMVVDSRFHEGPSQHDLLPHLDAMTNQVAVVCENLYQRADQEKLIDLIYETFRPSKRGLKQKLDQISAVARLYTYADRVLIYPLKPDTVQLEFDNENMGQAGEDARFPRAQPPRKEGLTAYLLKHGATIEMIPNVAQSNLVYHGKQLKQHPYLQSEGIRAVISVHIHHPVHRTKLGVLYLDYRTPQNFTKQHERAAQKLADLAAVFINQAYMRNAQDAREKELQRLGEVLEGSLVADSNERHIIELLLDAVPTLFAPLPVTTCIRLKEWQRPTLDDEPVEVHRFIYGAGSKLDEHVSQGNESVGISGRVMRSGQLQNVADVSQDAAYSPRDRMTRSELDVPILVDGEVVGVLNVESPLLAAFTRRHEEMAQRFAHVAAMALGNVRRQRNLRTVLDAAQAITAPSDLPTTLRQIADGIRHGRAQSVHTDHLVQGSAKRCVGSGRFLLWGAK
ncbi:MAG: GAF domain-containing protein [Caldilineaceae bacterium]|nr:GAF domain-containing protein [Caldilineaceae bacterium]